MANSYLRGGIYRPACHASNQKLLTLSSSELME